MIQLELSLLFSITESHYSRISNESYVLGDRISIQTTKDDKLERPRQFEVKLTYPVSTPLVVIQPDTVIITIKDNNGMYDKNIIYDARPEMAL